MSLNHYPLVNIIIPTLNNSAELDSTMDSIASLNYPEKKILVLFADFGSTDDTIDKIYKFRQDRTGVYALSGKRIGRTMVGDAAKLLRWTDKGAHEVALFPGDALYPDSLAIAHDWRSSAAKQVANCNVFVSEVDIRESDGTIFRAKPLFSKPCIMRAHSKDLSEYARHGYRRQVFYYGPPLLVSNTKTAVQFNSRAWWNEIVYAGLLHNVLYFDKPLACMRARIYEDELDQMAFRMELLCTLLRVNREYPDRCIFGDDFEPSVRHQLSHYGLWRAWLLHKQGKLKDAEDCFLFSRVINPQIEQEELFMRTLQLFSSDDATAEDWIGKYYAAGEATLRPKRPLWRYPVLRTLWRKARNLWRV